MIRKKPKGKDPVRWIGGVLKKSAVSFLAGTLVLTSLTFMDGDPVEAQAASADNMTIIFQRDGKNTVTHNGQAEGTFTYNGINSSGVSYGTLNLANPNYYGNTDMHVNIGKTINLYAPSADTDYTGKIGYRGGYQFTAAGGKGGNLTNVQDNQTGKSGSSYGGYGTAIASGTYDYNTGTSITYRKGSNGADYDGLRNWNYWYPYSEEKDITSDNLQYNNTKFYAHTENEYRSYMLTAQYGSASYIQVSGNNYIVAGGGGAGTVAFHQRSDGSKWVTAQDGMHADVTPNVPSGKAYFNPTSSGMTLHYSDYVSPNVNAGRIVGTGVRQGVQATNGQWYKTDIVTGWLADAGSYANPVIFEKTYPGYSGYGTRNGNVITPSDNAYAGLSAINTRYTGNPYVQLKCNYKIVVIYNPTRPGFNFTGWTNLKNCQLLANSNGQSTFKVTGTDSSIEATWTSNGYMVEFDGNGATSGSMESQNYEIGKAYVLPANGYKRSGTVNYDANGGTAEKTSETADATFNGWLDQNDFNYYGTVYDWHVFNAPYYANKYADLKTYFGYNKLSLIDHWLANTVKGVEGRRASNEFDLGYYKTLSDLKAAFGDDNASYVNHYMKWGREDGHKGAASVDTTTRNSYENCSMVSNLSNTANTTVTLKAEWKDNPVILPTASKAGYTFNGWYDESGAKVGNAGDKYIPMHDMVYYRWCFSGQGQTNISAGTRIDLYYATSQKAKVRCNLYRGGGSGTFLKTLQDYKWVGTNDQVVQWDTTGLEADMYRLDLIAVDDLGNQIISHEYFSIGSNNNYSVYDFQSQTKGTQQKTLTAKWTPNTYKLTLNPNGGEFADGTVTEKTLSPELVYGLGNWWDISKYPASRKGYILDGWYDKASGGEKVYQADGSCVDGKYWKNKKYQYEGDLTVYAQWAANDGTIYTVNHYTQDLGASTYSLNSTESRTGITGATVNISGLKKTIEGFTYSKAQVNGKDVTSTTVLADGSRVINLYYTRNSYNVVLNKGTGISSVSGAGAYEYGASVTINAALSKGYKWSKWTGTHNTSTEKYTFKMPADNVTDKANATPIAYMVKYDGNNATEGSMASSRHTYNVEQSLTANEYTKAGYTFEGWNTKSDGTGTSYTDQQKVKNLSSKDGATVILYAQWTPDDGTIYTVHHYLKDIGSATYTLHETEEKNGTTDATIILADERKDYTGFTYEKGQVDGADITETTILPDGSRVIDLYYNRNTYNLTLDKGEGIDSVSGAGSYEYGATVTIDAIVSEDYTWNSWTGTNNTEQKNYTFTMPAEDVQETANATRNKPIDYSISYDLNGGTLEHENPSIYNVETPSFTLNNPTKTGYEFTGWTGSNGATPQVTVTVSQGTTGDLNYKANWMPITYVIHFDGNGATSGETPDVTGTYDEEFTFPENGFVKETERGDSTFIGWSTDPDSTDPEYKPGDLEKNLTDIKDDVIHIFAIWDDCPDIEAEDLFFTLVEAQNGSIDEEKLLSYARAFDKEDGEIGAGEDAEKGTSFTVMDYQPEDFTGFEHEGSVTETYQVIDSAGNQYQKQITVYVVDTAAKEVKPVGTTRFINGKYFEKSADQGGLANDSIWRTDTDYNNTLKKALENLKNDTPVKSYSFTHQQILEMKEFIETNGIGNSEAPDALSRFYEQFMR